MSFLSVVTNQIKLQSSDRPVADHWAATDYHRARNVLILWHGGQASHWLQLGRRPLLLGIGIGVALALAFGLFCTQAAAASHLTSLVALSFADAAAAVESRILRISC
jgi:hypothetical protein